MTISYLPQRLVRLASLTVLALAAGAASAHGDATPQAVDTKSLPPLGDAWGTQNPFRGHAEAIKIGTSAYNHNCARCHGLEAISGGTAPDLRKLDGNAPTSRTPSASKPASTRSMRST